MKLFELISEKELKETVLSEYKRRLILYRLINERFKKKYGMEFEEFEQNNVVKEKDFSWEVEKDAMEWEHAVEGIRYTEEMIKKLKESDE